MTTDLKEKSDLEEVMHSVEDRAFGKDFLVLIVDDDFTNRLVLQGMLSNFGCTVIGAENGLQAVESFKKHHPDIVLLDVMMPVMDGYETARIIKQESQDDFVPILFLTAMMEDEALSDCLESGGDDFLTKPFSPVILKARIKALLRTREIYRSRHIQYEELCRKEEEIANEMDVAERIFSKILKTELLDLGNIKYHLSPMEQLNGDIILAAQKPDGGQNVILGDFTGHGLAAAIGGLVVFDVFYTMTAKGFSISQLIPEINRKLREVLPTGRFLAACFVELDPEHSIASLWNGGLPDVYIRGDEPGIAALMPSTNLPLGILDDEDVDTTLTTFHVNKGDRIILSSDGVSEAVNAQGEFFGVELLEERIKKVQDSDVLFEEIMDEFTTFCGEEAQRDDVSILEVCCDSSKIKQTISNKDQLSPTKPATEWSMQIEIDVDTIKNSEVVPHIVQIIVDMQGLRHCQQHLYTIITELYSNAVEHGMLDIDSSLKDSPSGFANYYLAKETAMRNLQEGKVKIDVEHSATETGGNIFLRMRNDGRGFDTSIINKKLQESTDLHGRGILLVNSLTQSMEYSDQGRVVEINYAWNNTGE